MTPRDPNAAEWVLAVQAGLLVVLLGGFHLARPLLPRVRGAAGVAVVALSTLASTFVFVMIVLFAAGIRAGSVDIAAPSFEEANYPRGLLSLQLVGFDPAVREDAAGFAAALLLPLVVLCGVFAVVVAHAPRGTGLRVAVGAGTCLVFLAGAVIALGDVGGLAAGVGWWVANLALVAVVALAIDRPSRAGTAVDLSVRAGPR